MRKFLSFFAVFSILGISIVSAKPVDRKKGSEAEFRYGLKLNTSAIFFSKGDLGVYFEYKLPSIIGFQTGLAYTQNFYFCYSGDFENTVKGGFSGSLSISDSMKKSKFSIISPKCLSIPLIVRFYPGDEQKFCLFTGVRFGIKIGGRAFFSAKKTREAQQDASKLKAANEAIKTIGFDKMNDKTTVSETVKMMKEVIASQGLGDDIESSEQDGIEVGAVDIGLKTGFDIEWPFGIITGLDFDYILKDFVTIKDTPNHLNWSGGIVLGWNIASLLQ